MSLLYAMVIDSFDWITFFLLSATVLSSIPKIREYVYPILISLLGTIILYYVLPVWALQYVFINQSSILSTLFVGIPVFALLCGLKIWKILPLPWNRSLPFFTILTLGWVLIRSIFWVFIYVQATLNSPFIRFQMDGPITASLKAEAWNFSQLQNEIDIVVAMEFKSLQTETDYSEKQIKLIVDGLDEAENFRASLFEPYNSGKTRAVVIAHAIAAFQQSANPVLQDHVPLDDFVLIEQELVDYMSGNAGEIFGNLSFELFSGKWYGLWEDNKVDHDWSETQEFQPSLILDTQPPMGLMALQYAWIGDGFGWNAVVAPKSRNTGDVILGTVYHVRNQNPDEVYLHRPHVGIPLDEGQLIWITQSEVFLEQAFPNDDKVKESYAITGFFYEIIEDQLVNKGDGFQAVYTRNPDKRPEFYRYPVQVSIDL